MPAEAPADRLLHPADLDAWSRWEASHHRLRQAKGATVDAVRRTIGKELSSADVLAIHGTSASVLVVVDAPTSSQRAALVEPIRHLIALGTDVAVACPAEVLPHLAGPSTQWRTQPLTAQTTGAELSTVRSVLAVGHYLPLGAGAYRWSRRTGARFVVVQHGLLTPFMAPLPEGAHLLAWSEEDATFWSSGRTDVTHEVVGGQLLWRAAQEPPIAVDPASRPTFLGQLHGTELGRRYMTRVSHDFLKDTGALYRPHPSERDKLSRLIHAVWEREGIEIDRSGTPLFETGSPVVSVFSTGVLEAAARGIPAWAHAPHAPAWLAAFHDRYSMSHWGQDATPRPAVPETEPALAVALALTRP